MATVDMSDVIAELEAEARRIRDDAADRVLQMCKDDCPVGQDSPTRSQPPGRLRDSLHIDGVFDESPRFTFEIASNLDYAQFTDDVDTQPHLIFAVFAKSLRFWWEDGPDGPGIYNYKWVRHPGTHGQHWFADKNEARFNDALDEVV